MIKINLLPHREAARKKRKDQFYVQLGLAAVVDLLVSLLVYVWYQAKIDAQASRNAVLTSEITVLDGQIKEIATLQAELDSMKSRQAGVESLQADRNLPVHMLDAAVKQLPEGVYLKSLAQQGMAITMTGVAQSQERVSELLRNLGTESRWLTQPQLVEITGADVAISASEKRRAYNFTIRATLARGDVGSAKVAEGDHVVANKP